MVVVVTCSVVVVVGSRIDYCEFDNKQLCIQSKLFITSFVTTEYSVSDENLLRTVLFLLKFPLYNRIFT